SHRLDTWRQWNLCVIADDGRPLAHAPSGHEAVGNVRIRLGECFGRGWRVALEEQHGAVDWIRERTGKHEFAARGRGSRVREMVFTERRPLLGVVVHDVVK